MSGKNNFYTRKKEIDGVTYTAQFNGISECLKMFDECKDSNGNINNLELGEYVCENVIVDPKVKIDDFEDITTYNKVVKWGLNVAQGKFRDKAKAEIPVKETGK